MELSTNRHNENIALVDINHLIAMHTSALLSVSRVAYHHFNDWSTDVVVFCISGTTAQHPLMAQALVLAQNSVMLSSQKSYRSLWNKWEIFLHKYFPPVWTDIQYRTLDYNTLIDRLLMFVTYLAHELKCNVRSIPSKMSALRQSLQKWSNVAMHLTMICFGQ